MKKVEYLIVLDYIPSRSAGAARPSHYPSALTFPRKTRWVYVV